MADANFTIEIVDSGQPGAPDITAAPTAPVSSQPPAFTASGTAGSPKFSTQDGVKAVAEAMGLGGLHRTVEQLFTASQAILSLGRDSPIAAEAVKESASGRSKISAGVETAQSVAATRASGRAQRSADDLSQALDKTAASAERAAQADRARRSRVVDDAAAREADRAADKTSGNVLRVGEALGAGGLLTSATIASRQLVALSAATALQTRAAIQQSMVSAVSQGQAIGERPQQLSLPLSRDRIIDARVVSTNQPRPPGSSRALVPSSAATRSVVPAVVGAGSASATGAGAAGARLGLAIGPLGIALAAVTAVGLGAAFAIKKMSNAAEREANRLSGFSGDLAGATAMTEIRREMADIRRASRLGPSLARLENTRSRAEDSLTDLGTELRVAFVDLVNEFQPLIDAGTEGLKMLSDIFKLMNDLGLTRAFFETLLGPLAIMSGMARTIQEIRDLLGLQDDEEIVDPFTEQFLQLVNSSPPFGGGRGGGGGGGGVGA